MAQRALADTVDSHNQTTGRVGTGDPAVGFHPIRRMIEALLCGQKGDGRIERIEAKILALWQRNFAAAHVETVTHRHVAGAIAFNALYNDRQVIKLKLV